MSNSAHKKGHSERKSPFPWWALEVQIVVKTVPRYFAADLHSLIAISQPLMDIHAPSQLKSRSSRHPAKAHRLAMLISKARATNGTYTRNAKVLAEVKHVGCLVAHPVASLVLSSAGASVGPAAVLAGVTLENWGNASDSMSTRRIS